VISGIGDIKMPPPLQLPPLSFASIDAGVYRSAYPSVKTLNFIESLGLKSMICLSPLEMRSDLKDFATEKGIKLYESNVGFNQEPFLVMSEKEVRSVLDIIEG
jgi:tyrosine-protein phosphatase SIW14